MRWADMRGLQHIAIGVLATLSTAAGAATIDFEVAQGAFPKSGRKLPSSIHASHTGDGVASIVELLSTGSGIARVEVEAVAWGGGGIDNLSFFGPVACRSRLEMMLNQPTQRTRYSGLRPPPRAAEGGRRADR